MCVEEVYTPTFQFMIFRRHCNWSLQCKVYFSQILSKENNQSRVGGEKSVCR